LIAAAVEGFSTNGMTQCSWQASVCEIKTWTIHYKCFSFNWYFFFTSIQCPL